VSVSREIRDRIRSDAEAADYWYVPKGQAAGPENWPRIAKHLRVLSRYESVPWSIAQSRFARELRRRRLIDPYKSHGQSVSAVARMQFPVWRVLGFAWITAKGVPEVTEVGRRFMMARTEGERRRLVTMQLHRYQFYNPSLPRHFEGFRTFPVLALYRVLEQADLKMSWDEFLLWAREFGTLGMLIAWRGSSTSGAIYRQTTEIA
jgi:hypothetical protein